MHRLKPGYWIGVIRRNPWGTVSLLLLFLLVNQSIKMEWLETKLARSQDGVAALLRERTELKRTLEAWKTEAVEWRVASGEPDLPPTMPGDSSPAEVNHAPSSAAPEPEVPADEPSKTEL